MTTPLGVSSACVSWPVNTRSAREDEEQQQQERQRVLAALFPHPLPIRHSLAVRPFVWYYTGGIQSICDGSIINHRVWLEEIGDKKVGS
jgi:hypothetical protein